MILVAASLQFLESPDVWWALVALLLIVMAFRLYRGGRLGGWPLMALRIAAAATVALLLLEPVLSLFAERSVEPRVAVILDTSLSMSIPDPGAAEAAESAVAGGMNEASASAGAEAGPAPTRADRLREALERSRLTQVLERSASVETFRFGTSVEPLDLRDDPGGLAPKDDRTDLAGALSDAVGTERRRTGAVVVLSDGAHNVGVDPRAEARRLGVPVWTVGVGTDSRVNDLAIAEVEASAVAYLDNQVPVVARVRARGDSAVSLPVYLSEGDAVLDSTVVEMPAGGGVREVNFEYEPRTEGLHRYRVWTPARAGEISESNNAQLFAVRVLKEKIRVLLVASRLSHDFTFLKRALESDVSLDVVPVVLTLRDVEGSLAEHELPASYAELADYDLVILQDVSAARLRDGALPELPRFVRERGGALLVMGTPEAFDVRGTPLEDLLPIVPTAAPRTRTGQVLAALTASGESHPVTRLESDPAVNRRRWEELPPLSVVPIFGELHGDARVLAKGRLAGVVRDELPLVATRQAGRGRVLMLAGAPYWRWDLYLWGSGRTGGAFARLASRAVRWLASRDELEAVMVRPSKNVFDGAESVVVEGQIYDDDFRPVAGVDVRASVRGPIGSEQERTRELSLVEVGEGRYRGQLPGLPPGDYRIEGRAAKGGASLGEDTSELTVAPYRMEFEEPAPDFALLRDVSRESGGRFLTLDEVESLPDRLKLEPLVERSVREHPFAESPVLFVTLIALLAAEWMLRRRRGLP